MEEENERISMARRLVEHTDRSLFLTGRAGTGKTTFLRRLRESSRKRMVVTAPTGIAAINAGGVTLHSFFQLDLAPFIPGVTKQISNGREYRFSRDKLRIIRAMDVLVIDEISMVRADLLDAVDQALRRHRGSSLPFGGVQLLLIGDLQQLPPVVKDQEQDLLAQHYASPYFFDSHALQSIDYATIELDHVYRQNKGEFLDLLNAIRDNHVTPGVLARLNSRVRPGFNPPEEEGYIRLTTHNHLADNINARRLAVLPGREFLYEAKVEGNFPVSSFPVSATLRLKEGAQVMFTKNDTGADRAFYNGMIGHVTQLGEDFVKVLPSDGGNEIDVPVMTWENMKFVVDPELNEIREQREGSFSQLPLKTAWAITIHKSQGLTFERAIIDVSGSFAHGQTYVALSRCRSMEGLVLDRPLQPHSVISDSNVRDFLAREANTVSDSDISGMEASYALHLCCQLFNFQMLQASLDGVSRIVKENFFRTYPSLVKSADETDTRVKSEVTEVGTRFISQLRTMGEQSGGTLSPEIRKRVKEGARYFLGKLEELKEIVAAWPDTHDNKRVEKKLTERNSLLADAVRLKLKLMKAFAEQEFGTDAYLDAKASALLSGGGMSASRPRSAAKSQQTADNLHPGLFDTLQTWRRDKARELNSPAYAVMSTKTLLAVANHLPVSKDDLLRMPGIGKATAARFGADLLAIVDRYISTHTDLTILPLPEAGKQRSHAPKPKPAQKDTDKKVKKTDTYQTTLLWWRQGKTIDEICTIRGLKHNTVFEHIVTHGGKTDVERLVREEMSPAKIRMLQEYIDRCDGVLPTNTEIVEALGGSVTFEEVRMMRVFNGYPAFTSRQDPQSQS